MGLFIDIHAIQTLPPANLNRDENGRPKTSIYGGVPRMRVSSQAWKKAIRDNFRDTLDTGRLGSRSREFTKMIAQRINRDPEDEHLLKVTGELMKTAGLPSDKNRPGSTSALQFFGEQQWQKLAQYAEEAYGSTDPKKSVASHRTDIKKLLDSDRSIDIAFFGRMSASSDKGTGSEYVVDAASQFAHAISVNRADVENDYYAAVDDCDNTSGAGMIGETGYLSATLYRYACVDVNLLNRNLGYDKEAVRLALSTFLNAFALSLPSGKQNSFGHQTLPSFIETVIRTDRPINLVEAYEKPVTTDTIPTSVQRLLEQQADYQNTYGLAAADTFTMADLNARKAMGKEQQETLLTLPNWSQKPPAPSSRHSDHHADPTPPVERPIAIMGHRRRVHAPQHRQPTHQKRSHRTRRIRFGTCPRKRHQRPRSPPIRRATSPYRPTVDGLPNHGQTS